jgi:hypothetical protein
VLGEKSTKAGFWITFVLMQVPNGKLLSICMQTSRVVAAHRHARELPAAAVQTSRRRRCAQARG